MSNEQTAQGIDLLKTNLSKSVKEFLHDPSGANKVDLQKVQMVIAVVRELYNTILDAAAKQLMSQKLS